MVVRHADRIQDRVHAGGCGTRPGRVGEVGDERFGARERRAQLRFGAPDGADVVPARDEFGGGDRSDGTGGAEDCDIHAVNLLNDVQ